MPIGVSINALSVVAVPQCIIFLILFFASTVIFPLTNDVMIADFKACGLFPLDRKTARSRNPFGIS